MRSKNVIYSMISNLILQIIMIIYGFIVPKIIITIYGSNVNGLLVSITQFLAYISLLESGFGPVIKSTLYKPIAKKNKKEIEKILYTSEKFFKKISLIFLIYIILLCFIYPLVINNDFEYIYTTLLIIIIGTSTFAEYFFGMTYRLYLQADQKSYIISVITILTYALSIIFTIILSKFNISVHLLRLITSIIFILRPVLQQLYIKKYYNINLKEINEEIKIDQKWDALAQHIAAVVRSSASITILTLVGKIIEVSVFSVYSLVTQGVNKISSIFYESLSSVFGDMLAKKEYDNLREKFSLTETMYFTIIGIIYISTIIIITPFITVFTSKFPDSNIYIRNLFGILLVLGEFIWAIRLPYNSLTISAGKYKETRNGAILESLLNIIISLILVIKFGIVGVTVGMIISMLVRTIEFIIFSNTKILNRNIFVSVKKILLLVIETILVYSIFNILKISNINNFKEFLVFAIIVGIITSIVVLSINIIFNKKDFVKIVKYFKLKVKKKTK